MVLPRYPGSLLHLSSTGCIGIPAIEVIAHPSGSRQICICAAISHCNSIHRIRDTTATSLIRIEGYGNLFSSPLCIECSIGYDLIS